MTLLRIALAQINVTIGDIQGNAAKIKENLERAKAAKAQIVLFPELTLAGYPPETCCSSLALLRPIELLWKVYSPILPG